MKLNRWIVTLAIALLPLSLPFAASTAGGNELPNGGDATVIQFKSVSAELLRTVKNWPEANQLFSIPSLEKELATAAIESQNHVFVDGAEKDAINFPNAKKIVVSRVRWYMMNGADQMILVLHEALPLINFDDSNYALSLKFHDYLVSVGQAEKDPHGWRPICDRSARMIAELEKRLEKSCDQITYADVRSVKSMVLTVELPTDEKPFQNGDLIGFSNLETLLLQISRPVTPDVFLGAPNIKALRIWGGEIQKGALSALPALNKLSIDGSTLAAGALDGVQLSYLKLLGHNAVPSFRYIFTSEVSIGELEIGLSNRHISEDDFQHFPSVQTLRLYMNMESGQALPIAKPKAFESVRSLYTGANEIKLGFLDNFPNLEDLGFTVNNRLERSPFIGHNIKSIKIDCGYQVPAPTLPLNFFDGATTLQQLTYEGRSSQSHRCFGNPDLKDLIHLKVLTFTYEALDLTRANFSHFPALEEVHYDRTGEYKTLPVDVFYENPALRSISLFGLRLEDFQLDLTQNPHLESIDLRSNNLSAEKKAQLKVIYGRYKLSL